MIKNTKGAGQGSGCNTRPLTLHPRYPPLASIAESNLSSSLETRPLYPDNRVLKEHLVSGTNPTSTDELISTFSHQYQNPQSQLQAWNRRWNIPAAGQSSTTTSIAPPVSGKNASEEPPILMSVAVIKKADILGPRSWCPMPALVPKIEAAAHSHNFSGPPKSTTKTGQSQDLEDLIPRLKE